MNVWNQISPWVSIPQAVGVVTTMHLHIPSMSEEDVSIPQAVGVVTTELAKMKEFTSLLRFNTASGRCCCNVIDIYDGHYSDGGCFNTASGRCCCNF